MQEEVLKRVDKLSEIVADMAPEVWAIYLRQQYVEAGLSFVALAIVVTVWWKVGSEYLTSLGEYYDKSILDQTFGGVFCNAVTLLFLVLATVVVGFQSVQAIGQLLNPEYYAIQELMP